MLALARQWRPDKTCDHKEKIRKGESDSVDVEKAVGNPYVRRWQWVYDKVSGGYDWFQSTWDRRKLLSYDEEDAKRDNYSFPDKTD